MPDKKTTELTAATLPLSGTELVPIVQSGVTKSAPASAFLDGGGGSSVSYVTRDITGLTSLSLAGLVGVVQIILTSTNAAETLNLITNYSAVDAVYLCPESGLSLTLNDATGGSNNIRLFASPLVSNGTNDGFIKLYKKGTKFYQEVFIDSYANNDVVPEPIGIMQSDPFTSGSWTEVGPNSGSLATFPGDGIVFNSAFNSLVNRLILTGQYTDLNNEKITIEYVLNSLTGSGLYAGWNAENAYNPQHYVFGMAPDNGVLYLQKITTSGVWTETSTLPAMARTSGDKIRMTILRNQNVISCQLENVTQGINGGTLTLTSNFYTNQFGNFCNLGIPAMFPVSGNIKVTKYLRESTDMKNIDEMALGNSIVQGYHAGSYAGCYGNQIGAQINAGGSETTIEILKKMPQIALIAPKKIYIQILENDATLNVPNYQTNFTNIKTALEGMGIIVRCVSCVPGFAGSPAANTFLSTNFASDYIDITTPLQSAPNVLNPIYDTGDTHPNTAGNTLIANTIIASGK